MRHVSERQLLLLHAGEDVIAGAVEDAVDARQRVADEALAQRLDDRDAAGDRGFEIERNMVALGERGERVTVPGEQRLVGRDDRFARRERRFDGGLGRIALPAHQLDEDVDLPIARERDRIGDPTQPRRVDAAILAPVARHGRRDLDGAPATHCQGFALAFDQAHNRCADRAEAGETHFQRRDHVMSGRMEIRSEVDRHPDGAPHRRVARGTTLCNFSGADSRNRRTLRAAWRMRCSFSTSAMRT